MRFRVCVYQVSGKVEFDVEANNASDAKREALRLARNAELKEPDCRYIALTPDEIVRAEEEGYWITTKRGRKVFIPKEVLEKYLRKKYKQVVPTTQNGRKGFLVKTEDGETIFIPLRPLKEEVESSQPRLRQNRYRKGE